MAAASIPPFLREDPAGALLFLKVQPRASANAVGALLGDELRVKVTAPPVDSAANEAVVALLAEVLGCGRRQVELVRGGTSRHKVLRVHGLTPAEVWSRLPAASAGR